MTQRRGCWTRSSDVFGHLANSFRREERLLPDLSGFKMTWVVRTQGTDLSCVQSSSAMKGSGEGGQWLQGLWANGGSGRSCWLEDRFCLDS